MVDQKHTVMWSGPVMDPSGYGEASRRYVLGLQKLGNLNLAVKPHYFWQGQSGCLSPETIKSLMQLDRTSMRSDTPFTLVQHSTPDIWQIGPPNCKYHVGMTTFETDRLPRQWLANLRAMDEVMAFSEFNRQVFQECGVNRKITVVPHGVDTDAFHPGAAPLAELAGLRKTHYVFGSNFDWSPRKNPDGLLTAYFRAFTSKDPVVLVLKTYMYPLQPDRAMVDLRAKIMAIREAAGVTAADAPKVVLITSTLPEVDVPAFYAALNCYVLPSRGEGWSLTHSEAMSSGLPTIGVNWSGNTEFMNDTNSLLVKRYKIVPVTADAAAARPLYTGHRWADPDLEELSGLMRWAFDNEEEARSLGDTARGDMVERFTWARAARFLDNRLDEIGAACAPQ